MTDPTAKGYTAPTVEEMRNALRDFYREVKSRYSSFSNQFEIYAPLTGDVLAANHNGDAAWADAYSKLPAKAAPTSDGNDITNHTHCSGPCCMPELYESGIKGCKLAATTNLERFEASYITGLQSYTPETKAAPESEDEAFERWWNDNGIDSRGLTSYDIAKEGWNGRARLDANSVPPVAPAKYLKPRIIELLEGRPDIGFSLPTIASALGANANSIGPYLSDLSKRGKIERRERGLYGVRLDAERPDTECDSCNITADGHEFDCPEAQD